MPLPENRIASQNDNAILHAIIVVDHAPAEHEYTVAQAGIEAHKAVGIDDAPDTDLFELIRRTSVDLPSDVETGLRRAQNRARIASHGARLPAKLWAEAVRACDEAVT